MIHNPPSWFRKLYGAMNWKIESEEKALYLTFDDGPTPEVTERVLSLLANYNAKATFFCIGRNVDRHIDIYNKILSEGHSVGNHTYSHLKGWSVSCDEYIADIELASQLVKSNIFRPPYGRISGKQIKAVNEMGYRFYMWDVLSEDYNTNKRPEQCLRYVTKYTTPGSIIVFHDSIKASKNLYAILPEILAKYSKEGYVFKSIE